MDKVHANADELGLAILAIGNERGSHAKAKEKLAGFVRSQGLSLPVLLDDGSVARAYGVGAVPAWVFIDPHGHVSQTLTGELSYDQLLERVEKARQH